MTINSPGGLKRVLSLLFVLLSISLSISLYFGSISVEVSEDGASRGRDFYITLENGDGVWYAEHNKGSAAVGTIHYMTVGVRFYTTEGRGAEFSVMRGSGLTVVDKAETADYGEIYKTYYTVEGLAANAESSGILELLMEEAGLSKGEDHIFYADQIITVYKKTNSGSGKKILQTGITDKETFLRAANWSENTKACCEQMFNRKIIFERKSVQIWLGFYLDDTRGQSTPLSFSGAYARQLEGMVGYGSVYSFRPSFPTGELKLSDYEIIPDESFAALSRQSIVKDFYSAIGCDTIDVFYSDSGMMSLYVTDEGDPAYICIWVALRKKSPTVTPTPVPVRYVRVYTEYVTEEGAYISTGDTVELVQGAEFTPFLPDTLEYRGRDYVLGTRAYAVATSLHTGDWCSYDDRELYEKVNIENGYRFRIPAGASAVKIFVSYVPVPYSSVTVVVHSIDAVSGEELGAVWQIELATGEDAILYVDRERRVGERVYVVAGDDPVEYPARAINCKATVLLDCGYMITNPAYFSINLGPMGYGPVYFDVSDDAVRPMYVIDTHDTDVRWMHVFVPYRIAHEVMIKYIDGDQSDVCEEHGVHECADCELLGMDRAYFGCSGEQSVMVPCVLCYEDGTEKHLTDEGALAIYGLKYCYGIRLPSGMCVETCKLCKGSGSFCGSTCFQCGGSGEDHYCNLKYVNHYTDGSSDYRRFEEEKGSLICCEVTHYSCCGSCGGSGRRTVCTCPACFGQGYGEYYRRCQVCNGSGTYSSTVCYECKGDPVCRNCQGKGSKRLWESGHSYMGTCPTCGGSGRYCSICNTTGRYDPYKCRNCKGVGYFTGTQKVCAHCHGEGYFLCTRCNGTGWVGSEPCTACGGVHITFINSLGNEMTRISKGQGMIRCECYQYAGAYEDDEYQKSYGWVCASTRCTVCGHREAGRRNSYGTYDYETGACTCNYEISLSYDEAYRSSYPRTPISVELSTGTVNITVPGFRGGGTVAYLVYLSEQYDDHQLYTEPDDYISRSDIRIVASPAVSAELKALTDDPLGICAGSEVSCEVEAPDSLFAVQLRNIVGRMPVRVQIVRPYSLMSHDESGVLCEVASGVEYYDVDISLPYSYWKIEALEYYSLAGASMNSISERGDTLFDEALVFLNDSEEAEDSREVEPVRYDIGGGVYSEGAIVVTLNRLVLTGRGTVIPGLPELKENEAKAYAYAYVADGYTGLTVINDTLIYNGRVVMDCDISSGRTKDPILTNLTSTASRIRLEHCAVVPVDTPDGRYYADPTNSYVEYVPEIMLGTDAAEVRSIRLYQNTVTIYGGIGADAGLHGFRLTGIDETEEWPHNEEWTAELLPLIGVSVDEDGREENAFLKAGYTWRFEVAASSREIFEQGAELYVSPSFRWIASDGSDSEEVDIYYHDILDDGYHALLRAGDELLRIMPYETTTVSGAEEALISFAYRLPALFHVCPAGFDAVGYTSARGMISYREPFWKKNGYLTVHFDIVVMRHDTDGTLTECGSYEQIWEQEGFRTARELLDGTVIALEPGEVILMRVDRSRADDYMKKAIDYATGIGKRVYQLTEAEMDQFLLQK